MPKSEIHNNITELDKIETTIELCINCLYDEKKDKQGVAYILEMTNDKLEIIKQKFDKIITLN